MNFRGIIINDFIHKIIDVFIRFFVYGVFFIPFYHLFSSIFKLYLSVEIGNKAFNFRIIKQHAVRFIAQ